MSIGDSRRSERLDERYGVTRAPLSRRAWWWLGVALTVAATIAVAAFALVQPGATVQAQTNTSSPNAQGVVVGFTVNAPANRPIRCLIDARGENQSQVGWLYLDLPASPESTRNLQATVRTFRPALAGSVQECWPA